VENKQSGNHSMELKVEQSSIRAPLAIKSGASFSTELSRLHYENSRVTGRGMCGDLRSISSLVSVFIRDGPLIVCFRTDGLKLDGSHHNTRLLRY
jgi:hypothetical protein